MTFVLSWKPLCAVISAVNSVAMSTLEPSRNPLATVPARPEPPVVKVASPDAVVCIRRLSPAFANPLRLLNKAILSVVMSWVNAYV